EDIPKNQARQRLGLDEDSKIILYFGLIRPYKGVDVLIEALLKLKMDVNLKALIVGEIYKGCESIRERLKQLPADRVLLIDKFVPDNEVAVYFRAADLVVLPYKSATQSGVIPIAYRCRRPVVATRVGGLPEAVEDGLSGWLVPPNNADELARAICCYFSELNTPDMEAGIETIAKRLTWERYVEVLSDLAASIKPN
ncbi:MAG: glycosyltransferase, partial [Calditrichaeota bacterium]|nr:glycosyltransferase [Calditrichota bacterium]